MQVVRTPDSARSIARTLGRPLGFVPTMGALHAGHLALLKRARAENAAVAASLFVNPLQFGPAEDFPSYPRDFERDRALFAENGVDLLYAPAVDDVYPAGFSTRVDVGELGTRYEGAARWGHFVGVATVVLKLLHTVEPTTLYLGQKDVQQTAVLARMVRDLDLVVNVTVCPTVREADGLALSSRNVYLSPAQRSAAPSLRRALVTVSEALLSGNMTIAGAIEAGRAVVEPPLQIEYLEIVDPVTFSPLSLPARPALIVGVVRAGTTRLIDNITVPALDGSDPILTPERVVRQAASR